MKPRIHSLNENLAQALRSVIGGELKQSNLGEVWRDDRTWRRLADELIMVCSGKVAIVDRAAYGRIFADAEQMKVVRGFVAEYETRRPKDQRQAGERNRNPYARWAAENTGPK